MAAFPGRRWPDSAAHWIPGDPGLGRRHWAAGDEVLVADDGAAQFDSRDTEASAARSVEEGDHVAARAGEQGRAGQGRLAPARAWFCRPWHGGAKARAAASNKSQTTKGARPSGTEAVHDGADALAGSAGTEPAAPLYLLCRCGPANSRLFEGSGTP